MKNEKPLLFSTLMAALLGLSACGGGDPAETQPAAKPLSKDSPAFQTKGMVKAVRTDKTAGDVDLKFELKSRPAIGQPLQIGLAFLPKRDGEALRATFPPMSGVTIQAGPAADFGKVEAASVHRYVLTVLPQQEGVFSITAIAQLDGPAGAQIVTFAIPILVGPPA